MKFFLAIITTLSLTFWLAPTPTLAVQTCCCVGTVQSNGTTWDDTQCGWQNPAVGQDCSQLGLGTPAQDGVPPPEQWLNAPESYCPLPKPAETTVSSPSTTSPSTDPDSIENPIGGDGLLDKVVIRILNGLLMVLGFAATIVVMYGGYMYIFSGGNPERVEHGKTIIVWALVGMVIIVLSASIVNFVLRAIPGASTQ